MKYVGYVSRHTALIVTKLDASHVITRITPSRRHTVAAGAREGRHRARGGEVTGQGHLETDAGENHATEAAISGNSSIYVYSAGPLYRWSISDNLTLVIGLSLLQNCALTI